MYIPIEGLKPSKEILESFGLKDEIKLLPGGLRRTFLVGDVVLKYYHDTTEEEVKWLADLLNGINLGNIRFQQFIKSKDGRYVVEGWSAYRYLVGEFYNDIKHLRLKKEVLQSFHEAIKNKPRPSHVTAEGTDPWNIADKMVWGEIPIQCHEQIMKKISKLMGYIKPLNLPSQLIQGDPHHILFSDHESPALIDLSWHYRPADFALAVLAADALCCWCKDECTCSDANEVYQVFEDIEFFDQLLLRAVLRRALEFEGLRKHDEKYLESIEGVIPAIDFVYGIF
ncbi:MAG: hypothetical protein GOP50_10175 [Candidatus Heimdallarchaeota archaeon]|nr:hypothetical protein [Candidatus Heimdallarchaeota archaeon]